jgi:hypothetical protein
MTAKIWNPFFYELHNYITKDNIIMLMLFLMMANEPEHVAS